MRIQMKDIEGHTSSRGRTILKIVIEDFVRTAHPVASKRLKDKYNIELSPASFGIHFIVLRRLVC